MARKPFPWRKPTPAQTRLIDRLAAAGGSLACDRLGYDDLVAFGELRKLAVVDLRVEGGTRPRAVLTGKGRALRDNGYRTNEVVVCVTPPQLDLLRLLYDGPSADGIGQPVDALLGMMLDIARRMTLRGWVERYEGWNGTGWARLTGAGREVVEAVESLDGTFRPAADARRLGRVR